MQDRFKFRVWDNKEEVYIEDLDIVRLTQYGAFVFNNAENNTEPALNPNRFIFEQCTGLKDKNSELIYEGDIVKHWYLGKWNICYIKLSDIGFRFVFCSSDGRTYDLHDDCRIIGNIHENPELLEQSNDN